MMRMNRMAAMCLALAGCISATVTLADTNVTATSVPLPPAKISRLADELADTSARLAELQKAYSSAEKITEEVSAKDETRTTVHWLSNNSKQLSSNARIDVEITPAMATDVVEASPIAPRPVAVAYRQGPIALAAPTIPTIIRAQANEDVFYMAQDDQDLDLAAQDELSPQPDQMPWEDPVLCCDGGCDSCCSPQICPPKCRPQRIVVVSTEAVFLSPTANGTPVSYRYDESGSSSETLQFGPAFGDASLDDFYVAPRIRWVGRESAGESLVGTTTCVSPRTLLTHSCPPASSPITAST